MIITKLSINNNVFLYVESKYKNKINPRTICSNYLDTSSDGIFFYKKIRKIIFKLNYLIKMVQKQVFVEMD